MNAETSFSNSHSSSAPSITHYGVSEQLRSEIDMLREVPHSQGHVKYSTKTVHTLAQQLVCRNYGSLCYELAHLNWAIIHTGKQSAKHHALLDFYWIRTCTTSSTLLAYFKDCATNSSKGLDCINVFSDAKIEIDCKVIRLGIYDHTFSLNSSRANLLSCFMEWLVVVIPKLLDLITDSLEGKGLNAIRTLSSNMQKQIYAYLSDHLPPAKLQQRYRLLSQWYQKSNDQVADDSTLQFWQQHNTQEGYAKYSHVVNDTLGFMQARDIAQAQTNLTYAASPSSVEFDRTTAHVEKDLEKDNFCNTIFNEQLINLVATPSNIDLQGLMQKPKVLTKQQVELIATVAEFPEYSLQLVESYLRAQTFGKEQHKLIQACRNMSISQEAVNESLVNNSSTYQTVFHECVLLQASNQQALLAIAQLLFKQEQLAPACLILLKVSQQITSLQLCSKSFSSLLEEHSEQGKVLTSSIIAKWHLSNRAFQELLQQSKVALKQINRSGFTASSLLTSHEYILCAESLFDLNALLKRLIKSIANKKSHSQANFAADRLIFLKEFSKLYLSDQRAQKRKEQLSTGSLLSSAKEK